MAIGADCGFDRAVSDGASMHALLVGDEGLSAHAVRLHQELLPMASAAGGGDMCAIDGRIGVSAGEHIMRVPMTIQAAGRGLAGDDLRVRAVLARVLGIGVAVGAQDFLRRIFVSEALHVLMAIHAGEFHGAMDGLLQLLAIHVERDRLAVHVGGQRCVGMAGETVFISQFVLGASGEGRAQQKESERTEQYSAGNFHVYEETPARD